jgi:cephalosporin hydroxylase
MKGILGKLAGAYLRVIYLFANWKVFFEHGRLRYGGQVPGRGTDRDRSGLVDRFHALFYDSKDVPEGWRGVRWLGTDALKCPLDLWVYQEILHELRPDLVIETGTNRGGSALFLASVMDLIGSGEVVSIDIAELPGRPSHPRIGYLRGSSTSPGIVEQVRSRAARARKVMVILDSDHRAAHVREELRLYAPMVTPGQYLIVEDTNLNGHPVFPGFGPGPMEAVQEFLRQEGTFVPDRSRERFLFSFNPGGYLRRTP